MVAKINRFEINEHHGYISEECVGITDYSIYKEVVSFQTEDRDLNMRLAELVLDALNKEFEDEEGG